jgi:starch phosphorylase
MAATKKATSKKRVSSKVDSAESEKAPAKTKRVPSRKKAASKRAKTATSKGEIEDSLPLDALDEYVGETTTDEIPETKRGREDVLAVATTFTQDKPLASSPITRGIVEPLAETVCARVPASTPLVQEIVMASSVVVHNEAAPISASVCDLVPLSSRNAIDGVPDSERLDTSVSSLRDSRPPLPSSFSYQSGAVSSKGRFRSSGSGSTGPTAFELPSDRESLRQSVVSHVEYTQGKDEHSATPWDYYFATARSVRDRLVDCWNKTQQAYARDEKRTVYYLSLEYLLGRTLEDSMINLGIHDAMRSALGDLRLELSEIAREEPDARLGNGGLGRFAACVLESMATTGIAAMGYGIRYEYGSFEQQLIQGRQVERADNWIRYGSPWEVIRPETRYLVRFGGHVEINTDASGRDTFHWVEADKVWAVACDYLIPGFNNNVVNTLRLWTAKATKAFPFDCFRESDYVGAVEAKNRSENLARVLYPHDDTGQGRELRLKQEYFFASATLQDAIARHMKNHSTLTTFPEQVVFQLNNTPPGIAIAELMRLLVDDYGFGWDEAWGITSRCFAYTSHTVLPETLETWPVTLLERLLPRQLQIIYEINRRFLDDVRARFPGDDERVAKMSLFAETPEKRLRMSHLCIVGSQLVNGVSELHGRILRDSLFRDFAELWPQKFTHVTNGVTVRRWLLKSNPSLATLITKQIGDKWITDAYQLKRLQPLASDGGFREEWRRAKHENKERLATVLKQVYGISFDPESVLDVHVSWIHESKRQLLNILHVISLYLSYRAIGVKADTPKQTFLFAGKAAPGHTVAKSIIELIGAVGRTIERDARVRDYLRVVFVPNYGVSLAELIVPAADLSEQISLAGTEASGTGVMKLALNGALTIGTAGGANLEVAEAVGSKNGFLFGLSVDEVENVKRSGYDPRRIYSMNAEVRAAVDAIGRGLFSPEQPGRFGGIVQSLLGEDRFLVLADFVSYRNCHRSVLEAWAKRDAWTRASIMNTCNLGRFSSDEVTRTYARDIWKVPA